MLKTGIIILLLNNLLFGDYFISFDFMSKNSKIIFFHFNCSKALTIKNSKKIFLFSLPLKKNIKTTCNFYEKKIIDFLLKRKVVIYSNEKLEKNNLNTQTKLTFLPKRFDIIIKNGFVKFYLKE